MFSSVCLVLGFALCGSALFTIQRQSPGEEEVPLILTPYIETGQIQQARELSRVTSLEHSVISYSGFLTVDKDCGSNLFFWFFPSQNDPDEDPVSAWFQGGPGSSSMFGALTETSPYELQPAGNWLLREYPWNRYSSVVYIDNPVGTGLSFTSRLECYSTNQTHVGRNVLNALEQFFQLFPELNDNPFYLTGESYAGKYVPAIAYTIHTSNTSVRLDGIAIGNGLIDPVNQLHYSEYFYQLGLADLDTKKAIEKAENATRDLIEQERWAEAADSRTNILSKIFGDQAGNISLYNFLENSGQSVDVTGFFNQEQTRQALHLGNATFNDGSLVAQQLHDDVMKSVRPWLEVLMDNYRVLLFYGQLDLRDSYTASLSYIQTLNWTGAEDYAKAKRRVWYVDSQVGGYAKTAGNFTEVLIRGAGHMSPTDRPRRAFELYNKFIFNVPF